MTVAGLVESFLENHARPNLRSAAEVDRRLRKNVLPLIGDRLLSELHRRDVNRVTDAIMRRGRPVEANRVFEDARTMLRWAVRARRPGPRPDYRDEKTGRDTQPRTGAERCRDQYPLECLAEGANALEPVSAHHSTVLGYRPTGGGGGRYAAGRIRLRNPHMGPTGGANQKRPSPRRAAKHLAVGIIIQALKSAGGSPFVFPADAGALPAMAVARTVLRAQARFGIAQWSAHDLRRTAITNMARLGIPPIVLGHVANHRTTTKAGVTLGVYAHHDYASEKRQALDLWAGRLSAIVSSTSAQSIPMSEARHAPQ